MVGVRQWGEAETSRRGRATAPRRRQPPHTVRSQSRRGPRQSPSAVALLFLSKKGKHVPREATGQRRPRRVSNTTSSRCSRLGSIDLTLDLLRNITDNFSDDDKLIGKGAFGKVYKGVLPNGDVIAIKRFAPTITGSHDAEYENEAQHLMRLKHPNIVQLVGYCSETEEKLVLHEGTYVRAGTPERLLCLEYMPKGSLRDHLSDETCGLEWNTRFRIIEGICYGLRYLHEELQTTPIIHMDLKPENILLDDNMVPKIADFGLSRLFGEDQTRTCTKSCKGTRGYMPREYIDNGVITKKFDIFSLGVIIIEIITGLRNYPTDETKTESMNYSNLVLQKWICSLKAQGYTSENIDYQQIKKCIEIGLLCVQSSMESRQKIEEIIEMLEKPDEAHQNEIEAWTHDLSSTLADPAADYYGLMFHDTASSSWSHLRGSESPLSDFMFVDAFLSPVDDPKDGRPAGRTDASSRSREIQHPRALCGDAQLRLIESFSKDILEKQPHLKEEAERRLGWFKSAVEQDLLAQRHAWTERWDDSVRQTLYCAVFLQCLINGSSDSPGPICNDISMDTLCSIVGFMRPDSKGKTQLDEGFKQKSMKGLRSVAGPSSLLPVPGQQQQQQQQQRYVVLKKTLDRDDGAESTTRWRVSNRWRAREYTALVPSDDGSKKLIAAVTITQVLKLFPGQCEEISVRVEFIQDEKEQLPSSSTSSSRAGAPEDDGPKTTPTESAVWEHMTQVHVVVATANVETSQRKKPRTNLIYAICHHCDKVLNAVSQNGTDHLASHLSSCNCSCAHSH